MPVTTNLAQARQLLIKALSAQGVSVIPEGKYDVHGASIHTRFTLSFMPGNRRTLISHGVEVYPWSRGQGVGTMMCKFRETAAKEAGVTLMLATVRDDNWPEIRVLEKCAWVRLTQNSTTHCSLWGKQL